MSSKEINEHAVTIMEKAENYVKVRRNGLTDRSMALRYIAQKLEMKEGDLQIDDIGPGVNLCRVSPRGKESLSVFKAAVARLNDA